MDDDFSTLLEREHMSSSMEDVTAYLPPRQACQSQVAASNLVLYEGE